MKTAIKIFLPVILITLGFVPNVMAQIIDTRSELFTIEEGLSQTGINCVIQDSRGYIWVGTQDGLDRYDGNVFKVYRHNPSDTNTICDNYIRHICEDKNGNLWIATNNGLSCFNRLTGNFKNYYNNPSSSNSLSDNALFYVYQDRVGVIWIKTIESLERLNPVTGTFTHYFHYNNVFNYVSGDNYFAILEDREGRLWVGCKDGLNYFDREIEQFERFEYDPENINSISDNRIRSLFEDKTGTLWVGTDNGLNKYNKSSKKFVRYNTNNSGLINNNINEIFQDSKNNIWIGTQTGISILNIHSNTITSMSSINHKTGNIFLSGVYSIIEDRSNIIWVGSYQGLIKIDQKPFKFKLYQPSREAFFNNKGITAVMADENDNIWIGSYDAGLGILNRKSNNITMLPTFNGNSIFSIYKDFNSDIWLGTNNGVFRYKRTEQKFKNICTENKLCDVFNNNRIYNILQDNEGLFWFSTEHGLHVYNAQKKDLKVYYQVVPIKTGGNISSYFVAIQDKNYEYWFGTNKGLIRYNKNKQLSTLYSSPILYSQKKNAIASNFIYSLLCDSKNNIWVGTTSGLCKYNRKLNNFTVFSEELGLPNNLIYAIQEDNFNNLWLSTNRGIVKFNTISKLFTAFDMADGLQSYEFNVGSTFKSNTGEMFFGGIAGFNSFYPDSFKTNNIVPDVVITSFEIIIKGELKRLYIENDTIVEVPYNTSLFNIEFAALDFTYPNNNQYAYQMTPKGEESVWIKLGNRHNASFSNLPPNTYIFKIKGANSDQTWSNKEKSIKIIIQSPFWKTRIAITIYIALFILLFYLFIQWRTMQLRKTNKNLKEKEQIAFEISRQKEELTTKNKNITDSINYAKRIQMAMMPSERTFKRLLPQSFVYHKPKDIVSGDFYWIQEKDGKVFVAAVDCTGHGVPGAFMSILGFELFRKITANKFDDPGQILTKLNEEFSKIFPDVEDVSLKDGMDIAFLVIDKANNYMEYAGAFNPLYIVRENKIIEIKGNRFAVSMEKKQEELTFRSNPIPLQTDDMIYIFSDGYADQFGGYDGKKFKYRRFRHLLLNIHKLPLDDQKNYLDESMEMWKGNFDQVDDILVIGIKVSFV